MTLFINALAISKSYGVAPLFSNISFGVFDSEKLGLIGPNGSGKSTLLKIMMGLEAPDSGRVTQNKMAHLGYLPQEDDFNPKNTIAQTLFGSLPNALDDVEYLHRIREVAGENVFSDLQQNVGALSGGWRKRLAIVRALLQKPDLLLMDEPTNHLDLEGILWLESILQQASFAFVLVTHDRYFLENTVNAVMELNRAYVDGYFKSEGNYSQFVQKREELIAGQISREQSLANKVRREQEWLEQNPKARTTKAQSRIDSAERLKGELRKISSSNAQNKKAGIDFDATDRKTKILIETDNLKISRHNKVLFEKLNLKLSPGLCLGLMGQNGSGKSTLLNILNGSILPDSGTVERAHNLRIVTFDQKREQLNQNQTLMEALAPDGDSVFYKGAMVHVAAWAKRFLFPNDQLRQSVSRLSGGEQARVLIANLMLKPADILLLDEPTNDLDIPTLEVLENSLREFSGAIVLITHDRFLLDRLSNRLLYLDGKGHAEFFSDYAQWLKATHFSVSENEPKKKKIKKLTYEEQKELSKIEAKVKKAEMELETLQKQLEIVTTQADVPRITELGIKIKAAKEKVDHLYQRWAELDELNKE